MTKSDAPMQFVRLSDVAALMTTTEEEMAKILLSPSFDDPTKRRFADFVHGDSATEVKS